MISFGDAGLMYLDAIFRQGCSNQEKHLKATPIVQSLARDEEFIRQLIRSRMMDPDFFLTLSCAVDVEIPVSSSGGYSLYLNFFSPSKIYGREIAFTSVHHHDDVRLTSVGVKGGYEFACFEPAYASTSPVKLKLREFGRHKEGGVISIEPFQPHVVFYPPDVTCTLALWSKENRKIDFDFGRGDALSDFDLRQTWESVADTTKLKIVKDNCFLFFERDLVYSEKMALPPCGNKFLENYLFRAQRLGFIDREFVAKWWKLCSNQINEQVKVCIKALLRGENLNICEEGYHRRNIYMHPSKDKILEFSS